jgi:hypothetical protein
MDQFLLFDPEDRVTGVSSPYVLLRRWQMAEQRKFFDSFAAMRKILWL